MLSVTLKTKPITVFFRFIRIAFFYVNGSHFKISAHVKNRESSKFQGGKLTVEVNYAFGQLSERIEGKIGTIEPQKEAIVDFEGRDKWGVLANGHALFFANVEDNNGKPIELCGENLQPLEQQPFGYHVHTFHALSVAEFFSLTALFVNSLAFIANIILTTYMNREKLSDIWNATQNYGVIIVSIPVFLILLWIVFVYVLYDHYCL